MLLFILESIGTSELILIGIIALIFLGPRKLPQIARTIGKTISDFRSTTNEFKSTWEREVNFEEEAQALRSGDLPNDSSPSISRTPIDNGYSRHELAIPEIKPAPPNAFTEQSAPVEEGAQPDAIPPTEDSSDKKNWL